MSWNIKELNTDLDKTQEFVKTNRGLKSNLTSFKNNRLLVSNDTVFVSQLCLSTDEYFKRLY